MKGTSPDAHKHIARRGTTSTINHQVIEYCYLSIWNCRALEVYDKSHVTPTQDTKYRWFPTSLNLFRHKVNNASVFIIRPCR